MLLSLPQIFGWSALLHVVIGIASMKHKRQIPPCFYCVMTEWGTSVCVCVCVCTYISYTISCVVGNWLWHVGPLCSSEFTVTEPRMAPLRLVVTLATKCHTPLYSFSVDCRPFTIPKDWAPKNFQLKLKINHYTDKSEVLSPAFILSPDRTTYGFGNIFIASMNIEILTMKLCMCRRMKNEFMNEFMLNWFYY